MIPAFPDFILAPANPFPDMKPRFIPYLFPEDGMREYEEARKQISYHIEFQPGDLAWFVHPYSTYEKGLMLMFIVKKSTGIYRRQLDQSSIRIEGKYHYYEMYRCLTPDGEMWTVPSCHLIQEQAYDPK